MRATALPYINLSNLLSKGGVVFCTQCGNKIDRTSKFCIACGTNVMAIGQHPQSYNQATAPSNEEWHYESKGKRLGPVGSAEIKTHIASGLLERNSIVWKKGTPSWVTLEKTDFLPLLSESPPPLTGDAINNSLVWVLAFAPLIGVVAAHFLAELARTSAGYFWWITLALNIALSIFDEKRLQAAGYNTAKMGSAWLVPVYLFKRAKVLNQNNAYFIVWIAAFCLMLVLD